MKHEVEKLRKWREATLDPARSKAVEKQHLQGKLSARQRLDILCDSDSFFELGQLAEAANAPDKESPVDGVITGIGTVEGRRIAVVDYDFTVMGGSQGKISHAKTDHICKIAIEQGIPLVFLLDGGGARAQDLDSYGYHFIDMWYDQVRMSGWVPMAAGILGPCYAGHANIAGLCDFVCMVENTSSMGIAGPHLVRASLSTEITHLELGGAEIHGRLTGATDMVARDDGECIRILRTFLTFFPSNSGEKPPVIACEDPVDRRDESLLEIVPLDHKRLYDIYRVIKAIVDHGDIFDIKRDWAKNIITCLARLDGRPVGIVANQPLVLAGVIDTPASEKMSHFVEMCDAFNIAIILLADVPGFMAGVEHEKTGLVRRSMKTLYALGHCSVPVISVVIRKSFGMGGYVMGSRGFHPNLLFGWPTAEMGGMGLEGAVEIMHRKRIAESSDPEGLRTQLVEDLRSRMKAFATARAYGFDDVIDPRDTRRMLIHGLEFMPARNPGLPLKKHGISPL